MDEILEMISSPTFLVGTLIAGFLLNIIASYFVRIIDKTTGSFWKRWRTSSEKRKQRFEFDVEWLLSGDRLQKSLHHQVDIVLELIWTIFTFELYDWFNSLADVRLLYTPILTVSIFITFRNILYKIQVKREAIKRLNIINLKLEQELEQKLQVIKTLTNDS